MRGFSSVGRALPLQGRCQEFESPKLHNLLFHTRVTGSAGIIPVDHRVGKFTARASTPNGSVKVSAHDTTSDYSYKPRGH